MKFLLSSFQFSDFLAVGWLQGLSQISGAIEEVAQVITFAGLLGALIGGLATREMSGAKFGLVIAGLAGLCWLFVGVVFQAGGSPAPLTMAAPPGIILLWQ